MPTSVAATKVWRKLERAKDTSSTSFWLDQSIQMLWRAVIPTNGEMGGDLCGEMAGWDDGDR